MKDYGGWTDFSQSHGLKPWEDEEEGRQILEETAAAANDARADTVDNAGDANDADRDIDEYEDDDVVSGSMQEFDDYVDYEEDAAAANHEDGEQFDTYEDDDHDDDGGGDQDDGGATATTMTTMTEGSRTRTMRTTTRYCPALLLLETRALSA